MESIRKFSRETWPLSIVYSLLRVMRHSPLHDWINIEKLNLFRKTYPYTMVGYARLTNAYELACSIERQGLQGSIVECGVWRGGCIATMAWPSKSSISRRPIWLFDSFEGLPEPMEEDGNKAWDHVGDYAASQESAEEVLFSKLKIDSQRVHIIKGWFQDTLPLHKEQIGPITILRLDGDLYDSTKVCLENLYDQVVSGGYVIIDDYGCWQGCKTATDEFIAAQDVDIELTVIDKKGRFWQKP